MNTQALETKASNMWPLLLLASSPVCTDLHRKFEFAERDWASDYYSYRKLAEAAETAAQAVPGYQPWRDRANQAAREVIIKDKENREATDRIIALMISYKCTLPDHLASPLTYADTNRQGKDPSKE